MILKKKVIVVGSGNAALCAAIAALKRGAETTIIEKASLEEAGGNTRYTAGAMRFTYSSKEDLLPLLLEPDDERIKRTDFGSYTHEQFTEDLLRFNNGLPLSLHQRILVDKSYETLLWLSENNIRFEPIYSRQSYKKDGKYIFWGGLSLASKGEGDGLFQDELKIVLRLGGKILFNTKATELLQNNGRVVGLICKTKNGMITIKADSVILGSGGFESAREKRAEYIGKNWINAKVRGTRHNTGKGLEMAVKAGASLNGLQDGCHAVPMDFYMPDYGNTEIPFNERKNYRKICYFLGIMLNAEGKRFVDEGENFRNYTYAQFGRAIIEQPGNVAWQIFDSKVTDLLYKEYSFYDAHFIESDTLQNLIAQLDGIDRQQAIRTIANYNSAVSDKVKFDPTKLDGKSALGITPPKSNWANKIDTPPFKAYPVTCGITFSYYGISTDGNAAVLKENGDAIEGLFACGEMIGGIFYHGYPGGSGLTSGSVFGKIAGESATE